MSDPASNKDTQDMIVISSNTDVNVTDMISISPETNVTVQGIVTDSSEADVNVKEEAVVPTDVEVEDLVEWKTKLSEPKSSPTTTPTYFPTYIVSYVPTIRLTIGLDEMEKGKSTKPTGQKETEENHKAKDKDDGKKKEDKKKTKDNSKDTKNVVPRQPYSSGRGPAVTISRPSPAANVTLAPSVTPPDSTEELSEVRSQAPTVKGTSSPPSQAPSQTTQETTSTTVYNLTAEIDIVSSEMEKEVENIDNVSNEIKKLEEEITEASNGGSKVTISGDLSSNSKNSGSKHDKSKNKGTSKVSISGAFHTSNNDEEGSNKSKGKTSTKVSMTETPPSAKEKNDKNVSLGKNAQKRSSNNVSVGNRGTKITLSGIFPKDGRDSDGSSGSTPTFMPSYVPTAAETRYYHRPSREQTNTKVTLSFSSSRGDTNPEEAPSSISDSLGFKPISYYTNTPTASTSLDPTAEKRQDKKDKKSATSLNSMTLEPTYFVYPTYYPTGVDPRKSSSRNNESSSPTYWPTYVPTMESGGSRPTFGFGAASGRESNFGMVDFFSPQNDNPTSFSDDATSVVDFMASRADNITSDQAASEAAKEAQTNSIYEKRICPGFPLGVDPSAPKVEKEVFFTYGIETDDSKGPKMIEEVMKLELEILEDVAMNILRCNERRLWWGKKRVDKPVSRVYYSRGAAISTLSECSPSNATSTSCAIVESALQITVTKGNEDAARLEVLSVINNRLENGYYEKRSTKYTRYLGPDLAQLTSYLKRENPSINVLSDETSQAWHPITFYAAIATVSLAVCALVLFGVMAIRNRKKRFMTGAYEPFTNSSIISSRSRDHYPSHSHYVRHSASPHSARELHHAPELSDWRSLVGRERF